MTLPVGLCQRAVEARDPRFDGVFFVGITTTGIYCRPICPSRRADPERRRFFLSAAAAERDHYRPCLRCRPELAPGRALVDAVSRLAAAAADRIAAGALNGRSVAELAADLFVSERHLRRALRRELGVSPVQLAQTHRLLLAKRLLADTHLSITDVAFASGFQSLRRFNAAVRERYRMSPTALRRVAVSDRRPVPPSGSDGREPAAGRITLTLAYRRPFAWSELMRFLRRHAMPGVERVSPGRYTRTVRLAGRTGVIVATDVPAKDHVRLEISASLLPVLLPLLARMRRLLDLDAEPAVVDAHLEESGLASRVRECPGLRLAGAFDGFEVALMALLLRSARSRSAARDTAARLVERLGQPIATGIRQLDRLAPTPERIADVGASGLVMLGVPPATARAIVAVARAVLDGALQLQPGSSVRTTRRTLIDRCHVAPRLATGIATRALHWPDAIPATDRSLQRAAGVESADALRVRAMAWRPWRAYAALHLRRTRARSSTVPAGCPTLRYIAVGVRLASLALAAHAATDRSCAPSSS